MDPITTTALENVEDDLQELKEEVAVTRHLLLAFMRHLSEKGRISMEEISTVVEAAVEFGYSDEPPTEEEFRLRERMRGRLAALERLLTSPVGTRAKWQ